MAFEENVQQLQKQTSFSENVVGCYLSNYKVKHVCPIALNGWCKHLTECRVLEKIGGEQYGKQIFM